MGFLEEYGVMEAEHDAWLQVNAELDIATKGGSFNDDGYAMLHAAIVVWSEKLVGLRCDQTKEERQRAAEEADERYQQVLYGMTKDKGEVDG